MKKGKLFLFLLVAGFVPAFILFYFAYLNSTPAKDSKAADIARVLIKSEERLGGEESTKNARYVTVLLRKIENETRAVRDFAENIYGNPGLFAEPNYRKYSVNPQFGFYWNPKNDGDSVLFVPARIPVTAANRKEFTLSEHLDFVMKRARKNSSEIQQIYFMTGESLREYPWANLDDLAKANLFKPNSVFKNDEDSAYNLLGPKYNQKKLESWSAPYWSAAAKSWALTFYVPVYARGAYKGVIGAEVSLNDLFESILYKKFKYSNSFPVFISLEGKLLSTSPLGYKTLKCSPEEKNERKLDLSLLSSGTLAGLVKSNYLTKEAGISKVDIDGVSYRAFSFPVETANMSFCLFVNSAEFESQAAGNLTLDVPGDFRQAAWVQPAIFTACVIALLSVMLLMFTSEEKPEPPAFGHEQDPVFDKDRKDLKDKIFSLENTNANLQSTLRKLQAELESNRKRPVSFSGGMLNREEAEKDRQTYSAKLEQEREARTEAETRLKAALDESWLLAEKMRDLEEKRGELERTLTSRMNLEKQGMFSKVKEIEDAKLRMSEELRGGAREKAELQNRIASLENEAKDITFKLLDRFESEKSKLKLEIMELNRKVAQGPASGLNMDELFRLREEKRDLSYRLSSLEETSKNAEREKELLRKSLNDLESRNRELSRTADEFRLKLNEKDPGVAGFENEKRQLQDKARFLEEANLSLKRTVTDLQDRLKQGVASSPDFELSRRAYEEKIKALEARAEEARSLTVTNTSLRKSLFELQDVMRQDRAAVTGYEEAKKLLEEKTLELEARTKEGRTLSEMNISLKKSLLELQEAVKRERSVAAGSEEERKALEKKAQELDTKAKEAQALSEESLSLKKELSSLRDSAARERIAGAAADNALKALEIRIKGHEAEASEARSLFDQNASLKKAVSVLEEEVKRGLADKDAKKAYEAKIKDLEVAAAEALGLREALKKAEAEAEKNKSTVKYSEIAKKSSAEVDALREKLAVLEKENSGLKARSESLGGDLESALKKNIALEALARGENRDLVKNFDRAGAAPAFKPLEAAEKKTFKVAPKESNILIVDDEGSVIKAFGDMLYGMGFTLYIARTGKSATQKLALGNYNYVFLGSALPDMDPRELYANIVKADKNFEKRLIFCGLGTSAGDPFFKDKKVLRASAGEQEIISLLS